MAYTPFDYTVPDPTFQNMTEFSSSIRYNQQALRDMVIAGTLIGWNATVAPGPLSGGSNPDQPYRTTHVKSSEVVRETYTWSGDRLSSVYFEYSADTGVNYDAIGTITYTYDGNDNITSWAWS